MPAKHSNDSVQTRTRVVLRACCLVALLALAMVANRGFCGEPSPAEYRVKSLFLLNFAKYVEWPANAFATSNTPIAIGLIGDEKLGVEVARTVEGKTVSSRRIVIQPIASDDDLGKCHVLFIAGSDKKRVAEILDKIKTLPVLSVGEADQFTEEGGVINFVKKEGKVRLEINLDASRQAKLAISARLLGVADVVKGKAN